METFRFAQLTVEMLETLVTFNGLTVLTFSVQPQD